MKQKLLLCLLLLVVSLGYSQNYRPFQPGKLHYFTSTVNYSVRIDSVGEIGGDSAFWMNEIAIAPSQFCIDNHITHFVPGQEGHFGDYFIEPGAGAIQFVSRNNDVVSFYTNVPIGIPWNFVSSGNLTAAISSRGLITIGAVIDSVVVIDISDGHQYQLTKNHGLYSGPNLSFYLNAAPLRAATLAEVPKVPDFKDFFAWQPGDVYNIHDVNSNVWDNYQRLDVLNRVVNSAGDSLTLVLRRRQQRNWIPSPMGIIEIDTITVLYSRHAYKFLELATGEPDTNETGYHLQNRWVYTLGGHPRMSLKLSYFPAQGVLDSCGYGYQLILAPPCNEAMPTVYTMGLGRTSYSSRIGNTITLCIYETHTMPCYEQAGWDTLGPCPPELIILDQQKPAPSASLKLMRNSQTGEMGVRWEGLVAGEYQWQLYDLNGRLLRNESSVMNETGERALTRPGSAGMYLLRISDAGGTWARTLRVPMVRE